VHIRTPLRQGTKFCLPRLDDIGEKAGSLRAGRGQRCIGTVTAKADGGSMHQGLDIRAMVQRRLDEPSRAKYARVQNRALLFIRPTLLGDGLARQMHDRICSEQCLRGHRALVVPFETRRRERQPMSGASRVANRADQGVTARRQ
jgi:hypothetical protein